MRSAERFNLAMGRWDVLPPMSGPRRGCAAVGMNGALYVVGGGDGAGQILNTVERYMPGWKQWETLQPMLEGRYGCAAANVGGALWVFGGSAGGRDLVAAADCVLGSAERYDEDAGSWETLPRLQAPRHSCAAASL